MSNYSDSNNEQQNGEIQNGSILTYCPRKMLEKRLN